MKTNLNVDTQALREKILDLAMRGKLVKQDAGDEPASVLLKRIKAEKAELVKEGKIKKSKKLPAITDDEKPFDIPDSWEWVRLNTMFSVNDRNTAEDDTVTAFVPMSHIEDGYGDRFTFISKQWREIKSGYTHISDGEIIIAKITPCFQNRKSCIVRGLPNKIGAATTEVYALSEVSTIIKEYFLYFFKSQYFIKNGVNNFSGAVGQQRVPRKYLESILLPLPPLAEQKRIANKVSELFTQVDIIEKNVAEYQDLEQAMRSKLLDLAMRGKLVEQDPSDEPASELLKKIQSEKAQLVKEGKIKKSKKLPEITDDEKPFDIPDSWEWVRLGDIFDLKSGKNIKASLISEIQNEENPYPCFGGNGVRGFVSDKNRSGHYAIIGRQGALCGNINVANGQFYATEHAVVVEHFGLTVVEWGVIFLKALNLNQYATSTAQPGLAVSKINLVLIPLPPLAEQRQIADKVSKLFEQLDIINNNLVSAS